MDKKSAIRLVISDMDGTILTSEKEFLPSTLAAVEKLRQAQVPLCLASARPPRGMLRYIQALKLDHYCAAFNGAVILAPDGTVKTSHIFDRATVDIIVDVLAEHEVETWLMGAEHWNVRKADTPHALHEQNVTGVVPEPVADLKKHMDGIGRVTGISSDHALIARLEDLLGRRLEGRASVRRSNESMLDITPPLATKGHALTELAGLLWIDPKNVACLGDAQNDISMLEKAGLGIAMGQADEEVRRAAHEVTGSNEDGGWAEAVERFIMPRVLRSGP